MAEKRVTVPLPEPLVRFVEQSAEREDRSLAGQIRHLVAEAARKAQTQEQAA